jgi:nucleoside-diphosphate kinase
VIALEIRQENAVSLFRKLCGPHDPEEAGQYRPNTIRAKFGEDKVRNAVHCTDLVEDGVLECEYFFSIL